MQKSISVVIPVYNGALSIGELTAQLLALLPSLAARYEIVFVEDDGRDNSWDVIQGLAAAHPGLVRGIQMANVVFIPLLVIAFGALILRLQSLAFGAPTGSVEPVATSTFPLVLHMIIVLIAGVWLPEPLVEWFQSIAKLLG